MTAFPNWAQALPATAYPATAAYPTAATAYPSPATAYPAPGATYAPAGAAFPDMYGMGYAMAPAVAAAPAERFIQSYSGGVIVGTDGEPAGSIPANSFS